MAGAGPASRPSKRSFGTTPTISRAAPNTEMRWPSGSSPGRWRATKASFTTATSGRPGPSKRPNSRPRATRIPSVREVARAHRPEGRLVLLSGGGSGAALDRHARRPAGVRRPLVGEGDGAYRGVRREPAGQRLDEGVLGGPVVHGPSLREGVARAGQADLREEHAARVEAGVDALELPEAAHQQARARHQHHGGRELEGGERPARAQAVAARRPPALAQARLRLAGAAQGRQRTEHQGREDRGGEREGERAAVDRHLIEPRQLGADRPHEPHEPPRDERSEGAAEAGEQQALGEQLAEEPPRARAEGGADRELALAAHAAREDEVGDAGAGHQQQQADRSEQQQQRPARVAHHLVLERADEGAAAEVVVGIRLLEPLHERAHVGLRRGQAGLGLQPREHAQVVAPAELVVRAERERLEDLIAQARHARLRRHHAHEREGLAVEQHAPADGRRDRPRSARARRPRSPPRRGRCPGAPPRAGTSGRGAGSRPASRSSRRRPARSRRAPARRGSRASGRGGRGRPGPRRTGSSATKSRKSGAETASRSDPRRRSFSHTITSRSGSG